MKANYGGLDVEIAAVIETYDTLRSLVERFDIPFELVSHEGLKPQRARSKMADAIDAYQPDCGAGEVYAGINARNLWRASRTQDHQYSPFIPASVYRRTSYHQAYERGVKIIGATAHYVNDENLDEGPIIMQDVIHVDHTYTAEDMMRAGRDVEEKRAGRALYKVLAQRVFVSLIGRLFFNRQPKQIGFNPLRMKITQPVHFSPA